MLDFIYPFLISFIMVFIAELGDKTQLLVLSFSGVVRVRNIILGIAIGSFFSHGIAILFGSKIGVLENESLHSSDTNFLDMLFENGTETYSKTCKYRKRLKNNHIKVIYNYISFILNHVLHPAFFPHFT